MGWDYTRGATKKTVIANLTKGWESDDAKTTCLAHCLKGNILWTVMERAPKDGSEAKRWIGCSIVGAEKDFGWGSKDMDEGMHPYFYTCPVSYLDMVPEACAEWRAKVREVHARKSIKLKVGDKVRLTAGCEPNVLTITQVKPLRGAATTGREYRLPRRLIVGLVEA